MLTISSAPSSLLPRSPGLGPGGYFTDGEGVSRHEVHAGLGELLVEREQRLFLVRPGVAVCGGPAGDPRHVPHPPVGRVAGQTRAPNPVAAVLVQTGQTLLLPEVALLKRLQNVTSKTLHYELYTIFSLG